jgi:hypothetical protein
MNNAETINRWLLDINRKLKGRTIREVRYLSDTECEQLGWTRKAAVLILDNGHQIWPSADDEGNDAGAMFTTFEDLETIPVI